MIESICLCNIDSTNSNTTILKSRNSYEKPYTLLSQILFRLDPPLPDHGKTDKKHLIEFLQ